MTIILIIREMTVAQNMEVRAYLYSMSERVTR